MRRQIYLGIGFVSLLLGGIGAFVPLLPTVPFIILAAFCFGRSNPALEQRLLEHPTFGPHLEAWRQRGAISRRGKSAALVAFAASALLGLLLLQWPWALIPVLAGLIGGTWILTRPTA
jgi:uncharacterized protein